MTTRLRLMMQSSAKSQTRAPTTATCVSRNALKLSWTNILQVGWLGTAALMMKTQIGLGVLSIPSAFDTLGIVPGVICLCTIAAITTWSDYMVGVFKLRHPQVYGIDDAGGLMFGRIGRETLAVAFCLCEFTRRKL